jgi:hypothetical protein
MTDIAITMDILRLFGVASELKTNLQKSSLLPIRCEDHNMELIQQQLPCAVANFPCKYLGLPLALKKLKNTHIQPMIDRMVEELSGWKADLLKRTERKVYVQFMLTSMLIYLVMTLDLPRWAYKAFDKTC